MHAVLQGRQSPLLQGVTVNELFERQVAHNPKRSALKFGTREVTYQALGDQVSRLAAKLTQIQRVSGNVLILMENGFEVVVSVLAAGKAGRVYIPVDPVQSKYQFKDVFTDCEPDVVLTMQKQLEEIKDSLRQLDPHSRCSIIAVDHFLHQSFDQVACMNLVTNHHEQNAYILYTSGSTGKPKGVLVTHKNLINYLLWAKDHYIRDKVVVSFAFFTSISFDLTVTSLFLPLITGNRMIIYRTSNSAYTLKKIISANEADILKLTPTHMRVLEDLAFQDSKIRVLIVGGEMLRTDLARKIHRLFQGNVTIYNEYGPTEATVGCMIHQYNPVIDKENSVPIGRPINNASIFLKDKNGRLSNCGEVGEIYISGDCVAAGYYHNLELTEQYFLSSGLNDGSKLYKTNDLALMQADGILRFVGRNDRQIKLRGYRIELEEVETYLTRVSGVREAAVVLREKNVGDYYLCAFIVCGKACNFEQLEAKIQSRIPAYIAPIEYVLLPELPQTPNGKLDRKKLEQMSLETSE